MCETGSHRRALHTVVAHHTGVECEECRGAMWGKEGGAAAVEEGGTHFASFAHSAERAPGANRPTTPSVVDLVTL